MELQLACPACRVVLVSETADHVNCPKCRRAWPKRNNVVQFAPEDFYWGEIPREQMRLLNDRALASGWETALKEIVPAEWHYATSMTRADWVQILPYQADWVVLDIGAGLGGNTFPLASSFAHVCALESVVERAEFIRIRADQGGNSNVQVVSADASELPFLPNTFDLIVMNGVLEWVALSKRDRSPTSVQKDVLRRVFQLLKPGGWLYLGIENRFSAGYILGTVDHSGLRYTSLMPRWMASWVVRMWARSNFRSYSVQDAYRTYTYSYWGYKSILQECGFQPPSIWGTKSYNYPTKIFGLDSGKPIRHLLSMFLGVSRSHGSLLRLAIPFMRRPVARAFAPSFLIAARKAA
jgi:SAM-dependent methyltransferase